MSELIKMSKLIKTDKKKFDDIYQHSYMIKEWCEYLINENQTPLVISPEESDSEKDINLDEGDSEEELKIIPTVENNYFIIYYDEGYNNYGYKQGLEVKITEPYQYAHMYVPVNSKIKQIQFVGNHTISHPGAFENLYDLIEIKGKLTLKGNMSRMFAGCCKLFKIGDNWDTKGVTNMSEMFARATVFNGIIINWNISNVISMDMMFYKATTFNQNLNNWDTSNVKFMKGMFGCGCPMYIFHYNKFDTFKAGISLNELTVY